MFLKSTKTKGYEYLSLVESYRGEDSVTRHRTICNFGRLDILAADASFRKAVLQLCGKMGIAVVGEEESAYSDFGEAALLNYGYIAYAKLWEGLGIREILDDIRDGCGMEFDLQKAVLLMAVQHLLDPRSKLGTWEHQAEYYGLPTIPLHQLYRALDRLAANKERIEQHLFERNYLRYGSEVDIVFYDVTTFAFQSFEKDELRNFGFSKDCKFSEVQVVMGLLLDADGMPIGYELFPGNTFDAKTMTASLENLKKKFQIRKVVIVADRGLNSKLNLKLIRDAGYGYIVACRLRSMQKGMQEQVLSEEGYIEVSPDFRYKTLAMTTVIRDDKGQPVEFRDNLVVSWSQKRMLKDKADRTRLVEKAEKLLKKPSSIDALSKRGGKKYLTTSQSAPANSWTLDEEKITYDARLDGYYGIQTSEEAFSAEQVIDAYHMLWRIEDSFRVMKSTLEVRPVFHWNPDRIRGHFVMCFLAFMMERKLESEITDKASSPERIREALNAMQLAQVKSKAGTLYIKTTNPALGVTIFKALNLKLPANVSKKEQLDSKFAVMEDPLWGQLFMFE